MKVLIVDDDQDTRILLNEDLVDLGLEAIAAADGVQALQVARLQHPDLIILDYRLPGGDGATVSRTRSGTSKTASRRWPSCAAAANRRISSCST